MNNIIKNKTILITGGANGIGKETVRVLAKDNDVIVIDNDVFGCEILNKEMPNVVVYNEDVTNYENISKIIDNIFKEHNNIDILINNAAIQTSENVLNLDFTIWEKVMNVNLNAVFYLTQKVANKMNDNSSILNIISTHYNKPRVNKMHYDVSKSGVAMLTEGFAMALADKKITVNALAIGATYTTMNSNFTDQSILEETISKIPLKYICTAKDVAMYIYHILNNFADMTTGTIFTIDGGRHLL